jgi:hypothetical protein
MFIVIDDAFENPERFRNDAIKKYKDNIFEVNQNYPGKRCFISDDTLINYFSHKAQVILNQNIKCHQLSYDFVDSSYCIGFPHDDRGRKYTSILYLNPNPPNESGTELFSNYLSCSRNKLYLNEKNNVILKRSFFGKSKRNFIDKWFYQKNVRKITDDLKYTTSISNKYNRLLIFDSNLIHRAQNYFGEGVNSRLCLVGFFG